ncbi:Gfo/Idh/MocA family protein [Nonomuraea sp. SBT364]|uniref:Gfo/Idh/MocA family protein n=1 Tax=Nonomuraea sp. SBT364 TaxID=1580530 RepID=UPI00066B5261|nr:Gfo/Idh/MocA family oxidoreductase [Nonomuraea sp. SBT364]
MSPVSLAIVGAGDRGTGYARWALAHPDRARVVAVADPSADRALPLAGESGARVFSDWRHLVDAGRIADAVVIATQDGEHAGPAVALAGLGYHILVEKPLAPTEAECRDIVAAVERAGTIFAVCHVLRYAPYTDAVRSVLESGRIGEIVSVQHLEPVGFWHQAHSYVRGNWRRTDRSTFMLLAKSSHDLDWLQYVVGRRIRRVSSFGGLKHFRPENRPAGAAARCLDCAVEPDCPYSAKRLYFDRLRAGRHEWPLSVVTPAFTEEALTSALRHGQYGRCVYDCDNDVVDHQVVAMEFDGGATGTFTMTAFTTGGHRRTTIFGTHGELACDGVSVRVQDFRTGGSSAVPVTATGDATAGGGHAGGDERLMAAFVAAVATGDRDLIRSGPAESLASHRAVFAAERARLTDRVVTVE